MKQTKKLTLSAMLVALGTLFMVLGAVIQVLDLTAAALASMLVAFAYIEIGSPYTWLVWLCTALVTALLYPSSIMWLGYLLIFGLYPLIKGYIERLKRVFWLPIKLIYANITVVLVAWLSSVLLGLPIVEENSALSALNPFLLYGVLIVLANIAFIAYDFLITVLVRFYFDKLRPRLKHLLK